jgi:hypothetical protein
MNRLMLSIITLWQMVPVSTKVVVTAIVVDGCVRGPEGLIASIFVAAAHVYDALHRR